jgi:uncharacterized protein (TIGR00369 family)
VPEAVNERASATREPIPFGVEIPFVQLLGFELMRFDNGHAEVRFAPGAEHLNSFAVTHGGALMTLLDVCLASAARSVIPEMGVVTIEMKTSFMRPAAVEEGAALLARGELLHRTATLAFTQGAVLDAKGQICAHATATFKYMRRLAVSSRGVRALQISTD